MAAHLSIATALDKNLLGSATVYLLLLEVDITDPGTGAVLQTLYITHNNEDFTYNGQVYTHMSLEASMTQDNKTAPSATLVVYDVARLFQGYLQAYGNQIAWPTRIKVINATNPSATPEIEQDFEILSASCKDDNYAVTFEIGAENPLTLRFPPRAQYPDRCMWLYKDSRCQYAGALPSCDYTYVGTNGCAVHSNVANYGGFKGLRQNYGNS